MAASMPPSVTAFTSSAPTRAAAVCSTMNLADAASASFIAVDSTAAPSASCSAPCPTMTTAPSPASAAESAARSAPRCS